MGSRTISKGSVRVSNWLLKAAALFCVVVLLAHEMVGAPMVLKPLSEVAMETEVVLLHHFSWHVGTVSVLAMAAMFFYASSRPQELALAIIAPSMSTGYWLLAIGLAVWESGAMWSTPAPYFWGCITVLGGVGVWFTRSANRAGDDR